MPRNDIFHGHRPVVIVAHPSQTDSGLLAAWRMLSYDQIKNELDDELISLKSVQDERERVHNVMKMRYDPIIAGKLYRVSRIKRVLWLLKNSSVQ